MKSTSLMCITMAALLAVTIGMPTAAAEVVYTPVNVTISGNGYIKIDLNHDGIADFVLHSVSQATNCGMLGRGALRGSTKITPKTDDGVVVSHSDFAAVLASGKSVDASSTFYNAQAVVTQFFICRGGQSDHVAGYLGLEFQINGQTHYGWAQVDIYAHDDWRGMGMRTTLIGFAYETIPGQAIETGQTSGAVALATPLAAQQQAAKHHNYKVIDVGTLGGPTSGFNFNSRIVNRKGVAVGGADTGVFDPNCGCYVAHGFRWEDGLLTDLGPLPGGANTFAIAVNSRGAVAGISENGLIDPITGAPAFVATIWKNGQITDLGTFGGSFSLPNDINSRGQAAGGAENAISDPFNFGGLLGLPSPTQWHATLWQQGRLKDLGTLVDGLDSFAQFVNQHGQAAGVSFTNSIVNPETGFPTVDPFYWENGQMVDLGTLGGVLGTVSGLNNRGQVIGASNLAGDLMSHPFSWYRGVLTDIGTFGGDNGSASWVNDAGEVVGGADLPGSQTHHAYLWKNGVMQDLGTVGSGPCSRADSINERGQIVGESTHVCGGHDSVAFLWENGGPMIDLNSFVPPGSGIVLNDAAFINEQGEIAVDGRLNGDHHAFILVPEGDCDDACESRIAANQNNVAPIQSSATMNVVTASPANRANEYRNRLMQHYHVAR